MLTRPTSLTLVKIFFCISPIAVRLERLISIETKEYNSIPIMKVVYACLTGILRRLALLVKTRTEQKSGSF